jgi:hypothetical protein
MLFLQYQMPKIGKLFNHESLVKYGEKTIYKSILCVFLSVNSVPLCFYFASEKLVLM